MISEISLGEHGSNFSDYQKDTSTFPPIYWKLRQKKNQFSLSGSSTELEDAHSIVPHAFIPEQVIKSNSTMFFAAKPIPYFRDWLTSSNMHSIPFKHSYTKVQMLSSRKIKNHTTPASSFPSPSLDPVEPVVSDSNDFDTYPKAILGLALHI